MSTNDFCLEFNASYNILYQNNMLIWKIISTQSLTFLLIIIGHINVSIYKEPHALKTVL